MAIQNALSFDVEDYFHVSAFAKSIQRKDWHKQPLRVERNTQRLLDILDDYEIKATFFILGWVGEFAPGLVKKIANNGHEVACHGYSHQLVYNQSPEIFREETLCAKHLLEDLSQTSVRGYRAASFSITNRSRWALDILVEAGFEYDSSIFPVRHDRYGIADAPWFPHHIKTPNGRSLVEFPLSTAKLLTYRLPMAGGGYFRLYPYPLTRAGLSQINRKHQPFIFYLHPWEIDPKQPKIASSLFSSFRHYNNLDKCEARLHNLLSDFKFGTTENVLTSLGLIN